MTNQYSPLKLNDNSIDKELKFQLAVAAIEAVLMFPDVKSHLAEKFPGLVKHLEDTLKEVKA